MDACLGFPAGECSNKECPFLHIDPESKIKDCPWYDRGFCKHGRCGGGGAPCKRPVLPSSAHMTLCLSCLFLQNLLGVWGLVRPFHTLSSLESPKTPVWAAFSPAFVIRKLAF